MIEIVTFGYLHRVPPTAVMMWDLREWLRDPAALSTELLDSDGTDPRVQEVVFRTKGAVNVLKAATLFASDCQEIQKDATLAFGCAGGKHRAASMGIGLQRVLDGLGVACTLEHLDIDKPRYLH